MPDTEVLPAAGELEPAAHTLRRDRCVVEPSIRVARLPLLRARLTATGGRVDLEGRHLTVVLDAASLRPGITLLHRALKGSRGLHAGVITFTSEEIDVDAEHAIDVTGKLDIAGTTRQLCLRGDLRHVGDDRILLWVRGILPAQRRKPRGLGPVPRLLAARRIHLEIAAEFVR